VNESLCIVNALAAAVLRRVAAAIPDAQFIEIPNARQMASTEHPETVNAAFWQFLSAQYGRRN